MPTTQTRRLNLVELTNDQSVIIAVKSLPDYAPADRMHTVERLNELNIALEQTRQKEIHAQNALAAARDAAFAAEWALHEAVLRTKAQVMAQYGPDSDQIQSLGLKKRADRKRPARRSRAGSLDS